MSAFARAPAPAAAGPSRPDLLRLLNARPWAGRVERWALHAPERPFARTVPDAVIAIPARDERDRIGHCLDACAPSIRASGLRVRTLVLVNGSSDDTAAHALRWTRRHGLPVTVVEVDFAPGLAHAGAARRLALELAAHGVPRSTALLTTDADARPERWWVGANAAHLRAGASLVCGRAVADAREASRLPARLGRLHELEDRYRRGSLELEHLLDPDPWNPWPHHGCASGASLAITAGALADVGGAPLVPAGEDRALARRVRAHGLRAVHAEDVEVTVSARVRGRARGGMADALRDRLRDLDPRCDEALEPANALLRRVGARARLRGLWPERGARRAALRGLLGGPADAGARVPIERLVAIDGFDRAWDEIEREAFDPGRRRLRFSELERELPVLLAHLRRRRPAGASRARAGAAAAGRRARPATPMTGDPS